MEAAEPVIPGVRRHNAGAPSRSRERFLVPVGKRAFVRWLGRVNFADALKLQEKIVAQKRGDPETQADSILLLEHDPVYTIGRTPDQSSLRGGSHLPHPFFQINRGGQATYHGPGQLMGYPIIDLRRLRPGFTQVSALD